MYLADDENGSIRSINSNIDFTQVIDLEKARADMMLETNVILKSIECRVLNGRKISIKAILDIGVKVSSNENVEIRVTLNSNSEEDELYKNPHILVNLPEEFETIDVTSIKLLNEEELKIKSAKI